MVAERLQGIAATAALRLPEPLLLRLAGRERTVRDGKTLDLPTQVLLKMMAAAGYPPFENLSVQEARAAIAMRSNLLAPRPVAMDRVVDCAVPGPAGDIDVRIYVPRPEAAGLPVLVYYHGGGWVIGSIETHDAGCRQLAADADCIVVSVDYRLAPEHAFPAAVDDALAAFEWVAARAASFGGDSRRIAVGGDSAGGNLSAVVAQMTRDEGGRQPCFQLLVYPVTDLRCDTRSYDVFAEGFLLTRATMEWFRAHYLRSQDDRTNPRASPILAETLEGLAPAGILTAGFDPLLDEGRAYADRLRETGVEVAYRCYDGLIHGFFSLSGGLLAARAAARDAASMLREAFAGQ